MSIENGISGSLLRKISKMLKIETKIKVDKNCKIGDVFGGKFG